MFSYFQGDSENSLPKPHQSQSSWPQGQRGSKVVTLSTPNQTSTKLQCCLTVLPSGMLSAAISFFQAFSTLSKL